MSTVKMFVVSTLVLGGLLHAGESASNPPPQTIFARGEVVQEGNSGTRPMLFRIGLPPFSSETITLAYSTQDDTATAGTDYQAVQGTVTLSPTSTFAEIPVLVNGDTAAEPFEVLRFVLRDPAAAPGSPPVAVAIGGIHDDDGTMPPPGATAFFVRGEGVREGNSGTTPLRFTVLRTNPQPTNAVLNLRYTTVADTASAGSDFVAATGEITLQPTQVSATVTVNVIGDTAIENFEVFRLQVSDPILAIPPQIGFGGIFDDDAETPPPVTVAIPLDALAVEPAAGESEARLAVRLAEPATEALRFTFAASPGATATAGVDFVGPSSGELNFAVGDLVKDIPFRILADNLVEGREIVAYTITAPQGVILQRNFVTLSIVDRPAVQPPSPVSAFIVACRPFVREGDSNARLLVKRVGDTSGALAINFATQDGTAIAGSDYTSTNGILNWVAGNAEFKQVNVPILNDKLVETPERFVVRLTDASGQPFPGRSIAPVVILDSTDQISLEGFDELCTSSSDFEDIGIFGEEY